ncbi:MAG TPA: DegQ family serine endoprotease [Noviherbaspirillum sp.]|uniref:DegQ family serine endoprotease n=1 Tax=Noviherbaspirillum sp. TaxID=1926288 RepID=UPI002B4A713F|nr:DegQ family serine endoprotease [Noviherbaspirillum sp.]HJV85207.1 DegQ family serine endoprotease [Noviherbaspirillum sp.]
MKLKSLTLTMAAAGLIAAGTANALNWGPSHWLQKGQSGQPAQTTSAPLPAVQDGPVAPIGPITAPNYRAIVERFGPAVVGITTEGTAKTGMKAMDDGPDDPFFQFFRGIPGFGNQFRMPQNDVPVRGQGSGFIIGKDGLILTNAHVVRDADEVTVKLTDRREYKAKVLGSDPATDVAVLKIDAKNLPVVQLGSPDRLGVGDYVLAIGSPFGFEQSATAGIVSAKGRSLPGDGYVPFIQTDVAVNPGNSGGPLFDASGNVVGINSQIYSRTGGYEGISFAIPIDVALHVKDQLVKTGKVQHARLGVTIQEVNQTLADSFKLPQPNGALVSSVVPGSAAARAGLEPGDVILKYNGQQITRSGDLPALVGMSKPGDKAKLEVWRGGKSIELATTLTEATDKVATNDAVDHKAHGKLGLAVRPLSPEEKQDTHLSSGLMIEDVGGAAARAGIEQGDVIVAVNGKPVKSVEQLQDLLSKESKHVALLIQRGDSKIFVPVPLG